MVAAIAATLFAITLNGHPALGDSPESIAGIDSLGILHAPGYPAYVLPAWLFTLFIPFGSVAFQVNLFSLVCAALSIGVIFLLARRCGAERWAGALGGLALASGASFWFHADFAKHDMFSGLVFIGALYLLVAWQAKPTTAKLVGLGALMGVGFGSSWPLQLFLVLPIGVALILARRNVRLVDLAAGTAVCVVTVVGLYGFVLVRAGDDPAVNWGNATTTSRLFDLVTRSDFRKLVIGGGGGDEVPGTGQPPSQPTGAGSGLPLSVSVSEEVGDTAGYLVHFYHEVGPVAMALAMFGLFLGLTWRRGPPSYSLLLAFGANLIGAGLIIGGGSYYGGYTTILMNEGFVLGCYLVLAVWIAIGATELAYLVGGLGTPRDRHLWRRRVTWAAPAVLGAATVLPSLILHWDVQQRSAEPYADGYAKAAFAELPRGSALFIFGAERTQPLIYRQAVLGDRPDVQVIATDGMSRDWYRDQTAERAGTELPPTVGDGVDDAVSAVRTLRETRPVYLDIATAQLLRKHVGYRPVGLLARTTGGRGPAPGVEPDPLARAWRSATLTAGMPDPRWETWPNGYVLRSYSAAGLEVARAYFRERDESGLRRVLLDVLRIDSTNQLALRNLFALNTQGLPDG